VPHTAHFIQIAKTDAKSYSTAPHDGAVKVHATALQQAAPEKEQYKLGDIPSPGMLFSNALLVAIILVAFAAAATRKMASIPRGAQNLGEFIVEVMMNFTRDIIGPGGEKYTPLVGTIFFFIFISNLIGQIPGFHSPTANMSTTLALGLIVFIYVQYVGIRSNGFFGYIKHFMGPMPALSPLLFIVELVSEVVKPFTLAMRLFGNIFGEDTVIIVLASLGVTMIPKSIILPLQFPILMLALLTDFVQALVFALLTAIYISLLSHHDEHEEHPAAEGAH
jgi:F-type H+-transporting ATPase subunit a